MTVGSTLIKFFQWVMYKVIIKIFTDIYKYWFQCKTISLAVGIALAAYCYMTNKNRISGRRLLTRSVGAGVFGIYVTGLLYITLFMRYVGMRREIDLIPFHFIKTYQRDFVLFVENILLFIPMGMSLQGYKKNAKFTIGCAIVISLMIELLQYVFCCGKTEVDDVMANVIGAIIGYIIIKIMTKG